MSLITGICQRPAFEEIAAPGYTLITKADAAASSHGFSTFVTLKNPAEVHAYAEEVAEGHDYFLNDDVLRFMGFSDDKLFNALLYAAGGILVALVMLGSVFLIYNSFHISLNERTHQFGILMSAGATEKQLRNSVLFEGLCIGAVGIPLGMLIGIPSIWLVLSLVSKNFTNILYDNVQLTLKVSVPALVAAAVISLATILKIKNFKRNKRRYRSIVLSLTLSVVLFVSAGAFRTYLGQMGERSSVEIDGDILFYTKDMKENDVLLLYDDLETADGITKSNYQALATYSCEVDKSSLTREF